MDPVQVRALCFLQWSNDLPAIFPRREFQAYEMPIEIAVGANARKTEPGRRPADHPPTAIRRKGYCCPTVPDHHTRKVMSEIDNY